MVGYKEKGNAKEENSVPFPAILLHGGAPDVIKIIKLAVYTAIGWWIWLHPPFVREIVAAPLNIACGVAAAVELHNLQKVALAERLYSGHCPDAIAFANAVDRNYPDNAHDPLLDPWKHHYQYQLLANGFEIRSAGPDGWLATTDDLVIRWEGA